MLEKRCQQIPKSAPKDEGISGVAPLGTPLLAQTAFRHQKLAPSARKVLPMIKKSTKNNTKEAPDCEKELPNSSFFGNWPGGLREALTIISRAVVGGNLSTNNCIIY